MSETPANDIGNLISNGSFSRGSIGQIPESWRIPRSDPDLDPVFKLARHCGTKVLKVTGTGNPDCAGRLVTPVLVNGGKTYRFSVRFRMSEDVDPNANLLFVFYSPEFNDGIFHFTRAADSFVEGEGRFVVPGSGEVQGQVWVLFRYCAQGQVWISEVRMEECAPITPRPVRVACTNGLTDTDGWSKVLDTAGEDGVDLVLLPEDIAGPSGGETMEGPSSALMSRKAAQHRMYVAGGLIV